MPKTKPGPGERQLVKVKKEPYSYISTRSNPSFKGNKEKFTYNHTTKTGSIRHKSENDYQREHSSATSYKTKYLTKGVSGERGFKKGRIYKYRNKVHEDKPYGIPYKNSGRVHTQQRRIPHKPKPKQPNPRGQGTRKKAAANLGTPLATRTVDYGTGKVHY